MSNVAKLKHYTNCGIQPIDIISSLDLSFMEGNVVKYLFRYKDKNGLEDLEKAQVYLHWMIEREKARQEGRDFVPSECVEETNDDGVESIEMTPANNSYTGPTRCFLQLVEAKNLVNQWRDTSDLRVVMTNGCFDLFNPGHAYFFDKLRKRYAREMLVIAVNSDESVRQLKGEGRPILHEEERVSLLKSLGGFDHVFVFDGCRTTNVLYTLYPDVVVKSGEWSGGLHPEEQAACEELGITVEFIEPLVGVPSTTEIINRIRS